MGFLENLNWRYATKEFDGKKIPQEIVEKILEAIRLAPSSFGLQQYRVIVVGNENLKKELNACARWDQKQVATCSHVLIFCADFDIETRAKAYIALAKDAKRTDVTDDPEFDYIKGAVGFGKKMGAEWPAKQAYIALGFAMAACAELKIDSCPMEAADLTSIKKILNLPKNLEPKVLLPIGYRSQNDEHAKLTKIRFQNKDLFDWRK